MEKAKKLKDLKKGDRLYLLGFTDTTPIFVEKAKRTGDCVEVTIRWDNSEYVGFGHALGNKISAYDKKKYHIGQIFSTDFYSELKTTEAKEKNGKYEEIGRYVVALVRSIKKLI